MRSLTVAATQMACTEDAAANLDRAEALVRQAAARGARLILPQELFETPYFCKDAVMDHFALAHPVAGHPVIARFSALARELGVVVPVSFFERANNTYYNSLVMIDADGTVLDLYRKSHIPQGPGYEEKFFFSPGDTGFRVWDTAVGRVGVGICWDQWFPETARACALQGAEVMLYPTAIGSEPTDPDYDSLPHWRRAIQGHAASNVMPVVVSNRIGREVGTTCEVIFYGGSFITDHTGGLLAEADRTGEVVLTATLDLEAIARFRAGWGLLRDRRPDLYASLLTRDGETPVREAVPTGVRPLESQQDRRFHADRHR